MLIEQGNQHQIEVMNDLAQKWIEGGRRVMVMKGQANSLIYPHPEHRSPGDIDCYLFETMFLTYHACAHFLSEGFCLKQNLNWAMFLQKEQNEIDWESFYTFCDRLYNAGESTWRSRWHVIRSFFKYRWRYEEIYQDSVWKQL